MTVTVLRNAGSQSARRLATALAVGLATSGSRRATQGDRFVINWGVRAAQPGFRQRELTFSNTPQAVANCSDKIATFWRLHQAGVPHVEFADNVTQGGNAQPNLVANRVQPWLAEDGKIVVRATTIGHSGAGISIIRTGERIPNAPLYTRYFRKQAEYRVHVFYGNAILIQQKRRMNEERREAEGAGVLADLVRTHANGWVFAVNDLSCDRLGYRAGLVELAVNAARAVGANHCAVDILVKHPERRRMRDGDMVVCEVNSGPALEANSTLEAYTNAFRAKIDEVVPQRVVAVRRPRRA